MNKTARMMLMSNKDRNRSSSGRYDRDVERNRPDYRRERSDFDRDYRGRSDYDRGYDYDREHRDRRRDDDRRDPYEYRDDEDRHSRRGREREVDFYGRLSHKKGRVSELTEEDAKAWVKGMENADGTTGPHWSPEEVRQLVRQKGLSVDFWPFYAALNAEYSDRCKVNEKYGVNKIEFYVDCVKAFWLEDADAVKHKTAIYYDCIVDKDD